MKTKYEIKYCDFKNKRFKTVYTDSYIKFIIIRLTKEVVYYKVSNEDKFDDFVV